jgi:hypothetical protein
VRSRPRRSRLRLIVGRALVLAALGSQLAAISDELLVAHVTCPADGELVHLDAQTARPVVAREARLAPAARESDRHEHGQCLLDDDVDQLPPRAAERPFVPTSRTAPAPVAAATSLAVAGVPIYRLAPKNSPPA